VWQSTDHRGNMRDRSKQFRRSLLQGPRVFVPFRAPTSLAARCPVGRARRVRLRWLRRKRWISAYNGGSAPCNQGRHAPTRLASWTRVRRCASEIL